MSAGWNPMTGRDATGTMPSLAPLGAPVPAQGQPYIPYAGGGPGYNFGTVPQHAYMAYSPMSQVFPFQQPGAEIQTPYTFSVQPNGTANLLSRQPQQPPSIDPSMPASQMTNSSGGVGCEPGYNYFFPAEHTKVHVFKSETAPWTLPLNAQIPFLASHVPSQITLAELLRGFGCTNSSPKKNRCFEIVTSGNGKWYKGWGFGGDDKDTLKQTMKDVGWDSTRSGLPGEKPVVCLWFCKS